MSLVGSMVRGRKWLSDITNTTHQQRGARFVVDQENPDSIAGTSTKVYIAQLVKDNTALVRLLEERNQIIELSRQELQKLRLTLQKAYQQNWQLAQGNSQMLAELNMGKHKLKALQHELGCSAALLKVKNLELEEKEKRIKLLNGKITTKERPIECSETARDSCHQVKKPCDKISTKEKTTKCNEVPGDTASLTIKEPSNPNGKRILRSHSLGSSIITQEGAEKEKDYGCRKSLQRQPSNYKIKSELHQPTEDLFELEDEKFPVPPTLNDPMNEDRPVQPLLSVASSSTSIAKPDNDEEHMDRDDSQQYQVQESRRTSIGRPVRKASIGISYKENTLKNKLRRSC